MNVFKNNAADRTMPQAIEDVVAETNAAITVACKTRKPGINPNEEVWNIHIFFINGRWVISSNYEDYLEMVAYKGGKFYWHNPEDGTQVAIGGDAIKAIVNHWVAYYFG